MVQFLANEILVMNNQEYLEDIVAPQDAPMNEENNEELALGAQDEEVNPYLPLSPPGDQRRQNAEVMNGGFDNEVVQIDNNENNEHLENNNDEPPGADEPAPPYEGVQRDAQEGLMLRNLREELDEHFNNVVQQNNNRYQHRERYLPFSPAETPSSSNSPNREFEISDEESDRPSASPSASDEDQPFLNEIVAREIGHMRLADRLTRKRKNDPDDVEPDEKRTHYDEVENVFVQGDNKPAEPVSRKRKAPEKSSGARNKHRRNSAVDHQEGCSTSTFHRSIFSRRRDPSEDDDDSGHGHSGSMYQCNTDMNPPGDVQSR